MEIAAWYLLGFIAVHFLFRWLLIRAGITDGPLGRRLRAARLHPWRGSALLLVIAAGLVLQLAHAPVWVGVAVIYPAFAVIWLVSESMVVRALRDEGAPRALRVIHAVRLVVYLLAIVGLGAIIHVSTSTAGSWRWIGVGVAGVFVTVAIAVLVVAWRESSAMQVSVRDIVDRVAKDMQRASDASAGRADRVEVLARAGRLDAALLQAAPLFSEVSDDEPPWGVMAAACRAAQALVIAHAKAGDPDGAAAMLDTLAAVADRADLGVVAGITAMTGMGAVVDALLAAEQRSEAVRALDVLAAVHRSSPGIDSPRNGPIARVLAALLAAGDLDTARDVFCRHVAAAVPPISLDAALVARLEAP